MAEYRKTKYGFIVTYSKYSPASKSLKKNRYKAAGLTEAKAFIEKVGFKAVMAMAQDINDKASTLESRKKNYFYKHIIPKLEQAFIEILKCVGHSQLERTERIMEKTNSILKELNKTISDYRPGKKDYIKTNYFIIDSLFDERNRGILEGTVTLLSGPSGSGKSTLTLNIAKSFIESGRNVFLFDTEFGFNQDILEKTKMLHLLYDKDNNPDARFMIFQEQDYSKIEKVVDTIVHDSNPSLIIFDSVTAIRPKQANDMSAEDEIIGLQSRLMSNFFIKYKSLLSSSRTTVIMCNQLRFHIDTNKGKSKEGGSGGCALQHYPDYRIMIEPLLEKDKDPFFNIPLDNDYKKSKKKVHPDGMFYKIYCEKNRASLPYRTFTLPILFGEGISESFSLKGLLIDLSILTKLPYNNFIVDSPFESKRFTSEVALLRWIDENMNMIKDTLIKQNAACE